jgi:ABC-type maltose transport system permease subunit
MPGFPLIINEGATLKHYRRLFLETPFFTFLRNTALVTALVVMIYDVSGLTAGVTKG